MNLSLFAMFWHAGPMVKFVMMMLLGFSGFSWYIVFQKYLLFKATKKDSARFLRMFWGSKNLVEASNAAADSYICPESAIFRNGYNELQKIKKSRAVTSVEETLESRLAGMDILKRALQKAEANEVYRLGKSLPFLATTGSTTPFVGLFGTVWGIMNSFQEIGIIGSASLAVVAPGISESLVATAAGLAVAIPAVIFYNFYSNQLSDMESDMQSFAADLLNLVERDIISKN
ncbi:MAG: protein TolQ [Proteobacteria bacterium]|nr:protein TolQ [Pseudomonadota bacterium]MBU1715911.1 protein TolQ [Pseudomonadota bacterium]